jgi:hypothetical protein
MSSTSLSLVPQFLSKNVWTILGITALFHVIAGLVLHTSMSIGMLALVGVVMVVVTYKHLAWGMAGAFFEVIVGAHGHLIDATIAGFPVSLRMVVFLAVMTGWFMGFLRKRWHLSFVWRRDLPFVGLFVMVAYGVVRGMLLGQSVGALVDDANSYVTLLYLLPLASIVWTQECRRLFLTTFFVGTLWISFFTLVLTYIFTHISQENIWHMYVLVRDTRMFEVTLLSSPAWIADHLVGGDWYFRVFSQAQIFVPLYILILTSSLVFLRLGREEKIPSVVWIWFVFLFAAFLQSLSRSFLVGFIVGACALFGFWLLGGRGAWKMWSVVARRKVGLLFSFVAAGVLLWALISVPVPARPDLTHSPFYRGNSDNLRELAVSSRWNMLAPLVSAIVEYPVLGQGFGKELTYISDDPRIVEMSEGTGELITYRFEWGFLDVWLKMGLFGVMVYAWMLFALVFQVYRNVLVVGPWSFAAVRERWLEIGFVSGTVMLFAVHVFTPYLNHPIGLLYLLVCAFMIDWKRRNVEKQVVMPERKKELFLQNAPLGISVRE